MRRLARIAVKAACIYTAMSLVVAIVMAEMTLHPLRLPLPDNRGGVVGYGQVFLQKGYRILLPDSRADGESGGAMATYGC